MLTEELLHSALSSLSSYQLRQKFNDVYETMVNICNDFREAKLDSAIIALENVELVDSEMTKLYEFQRAITCLTEAFTLSLSLLQRKQRKRFIFNYNVDFIPESQRKSWELGIVDICSLLYLLYKRINVQELTDKWFREAVIRYEIWLQNYINFTIEQLKTLNPDYITTNSYRTTKRMEYSDVMVVYEDAIENEDVPSSKGWDYIHNQRASRMESFKINLVNSTILEYSKLS